MCTTLATGPVQLAGGASQKVPEIGAKPANLSDIAQARFQVIMPPAEKPVAISRVSSIGNRAAAS